jgi:GPI mannosyltransferase 3
MRYHSNTWLLFGVFVYSLTAWFSEGYHHPDEHFQILEFAHFKLSPTPPPHSLAWEYEAQIRPGLQVFIAWCLMKMFSLIGISNPFIQSFLFRWLSGMAALWIYSRFFKHLPDYQKFISFFALIFLWFMPYLSVRFSSEQTSGLVFVLGIYAILRPSNVWYWGLAGLCFSLSFYLRYQMGFALLGTAVWLMLHHPALQNKEVWAGLLSGGFCGIIIGTATDYWLYQQWSFPYINYFIVNIVEHKAAHWGTSPFWYYPVEAILAGIPPVSVFFVGLAVWGAWNQRNHVLVWSVVPFILAHSFVGHKELRFMFPVLFPLFVFALWGFFDLSYFQKNRALRILGKFALGLNLLLWLGRSFTAAQEAFPNLRFLYAYAEKQPCTVYVLEKNPYCLVGPEARYLQHPRLNLKLVSGMSAITVQENTLFLSQTLQFPSGGTGIAGSRVYTYIPEWLLPFNINHWQERSRIWSIWKVN